MSDEFYANTWSHAIEHLEAIQAKVERDGLGDDSYLQKLTEPHCQGRLAKGLAETYLLLGIAHQRGILKPWDMMLPELVTEARINAEGDTFGAALEAMDRLGQPMESE